MKDRLRRRMEEIVTTARGSGELPEVLAMATIPTKRRLLAFLIPVLRAFLDRPVYVAVVSGELSVLKPRLMDQRAEVIFTEPLSALTVAFWKRGFRTRLALRRPQGDEIALEFSRMWRQEAERLKVRLEER